MKTWSPKVGVKRSPIPPPTRVDLANKWHTIMCEVRDTAGKETKKMSELMTKTMPAVKPVSRPMTREETDAAFGSANDAGGVYAAMRTRADEFKADDKAGRGPRMAGAMTPDTDVLWQGDVGVVFLSDAAFNAMKDLKPIGGGESYVQVAVGQGVGARHTVSTAEVRVLVAPNAGPLDGPIVEAACPWTMAHPEHQNVTFPPGKYAIHYQRQYAEELRRAAD